MTDADPLAAVADDFLARFRRGEHPSVSDYAARHPELAGELSDLLQTLVLLESDGDGAAPPRQLGEYRVVREVGRGGMGVVYEAEQESLGRRVAVKVLPAAALLRPAARERFAREARAAARLHHTNVVPVFGIGLAGGVHYYAMQFIDGRGLDAGLPPSLEPRPQRVARIGVQVADALAHAHVHGVLHRDVKPGNVLLDADGTAWLGDFGLAQLGSDDALTATGDIPGTLRYLAPERLTGPATPQSDVYSLGVTLYELVTGTPAFPETDRARLLFDLANREIVPPRVLAPDVPPDLERVVLKAAARDPADRYAGAAELAVDLRCFLAGRSVAARRLSAWERLRRWLRRNRTLAASFALTLAVLLAGLATTAWQWRAAGRERDLQAAERARAEGRLRQVQRVLASVGELMVEWPGNEPLRLKLLESVRESLATAGPDARTDPALYLELVRLNMRLGHLRLGLGQPEEARQAFAEAAALAEAAGAPLNELTAAREAMTAHEHLAIAKGKLGQPTSDHEVAYARLAERMQLLGPDDLYLLQSMAAKLRGTGMKLLERGEPAAAEASLLSARRLGDRWLARAGPKGEKWRLPALLFIATTRAQLGAALRDQGRFNEARTEFEAAIEAARPAAGYRYGDEDMATCQFEYASLGPGRLGRDRWADALAQAYALSVKLHRNHPDVSDFYARVARTAAVHAAALLTLARPAEAAAVCTDALQTCADAERRFGPSEVRAKAKASLDATLADARRQLPAP